MSAVTVVEADVDGMRVLLARAPRTHVAAGVLEVRTGYASDPAGREGMAHVTEHVRAAAASATGRLRVAGLTEAMTTRYAAGGPHGDAPALVEALLCILDVAVAHPGEHATELNAVLIEMARLEDDPRLAIAPVAVRAALPTSVQAIADLSTPATIATITADDVTAFTAAAYAPRGSRLCLVSRHEPARLLDDIEARLTRVARSEPAPDPAGPGVPRDRVTGTAAPPCVVLVAHAPHGEGTDLSALDIAFEMLFGSDGTIPAAAAAAGLSSLGFSVLPAPDSRVGTLAWPPADPRRIGEFTAALDTYRADAAHLGAVRTRLRAAMMFEQTSAAGLARQLSRYASGTGPWPAPADLVATSDLDVRRRLESIMKTASLWQLSEDGARKLWGMV